MKYVYGSLILLCAASLTLAGVSLTLAMVQSETPNGFAMLFLTVCLALVSGASFYALYMLDYTGQ